MINPVDIALFLALQTGGKSSGSSSGGSSDLAWKPTVSSNGDISWTLTSNTTKPAMQNIKGQAGRSIVSVTLTAENHLIVTYDDNTSDDAGELETVQGEKGDSGNDGFSPTISVSENTETTYKLLITTKDGSFETPNLKGANGTSGGDTPSTVVIDTELSETSENPVQNKIITNQVNTLWTQVSNLNNLISLISQGEGNIEVTTLYDSKDPDSYKSYWNFMCSQWDNREFSFEETSTKNTDFHDSETGYIKFSNSFGWGADVMAVCSKPVQMNKNSYLKVDYNCSSDGDGIVTEILSTPDFTSQKVSDFGVIPAFYATNIFISANFETTSQVEGSYTLRFKINTTNSAFTIRNISVVSYAGEIINYSL